MAKKVINKSIETKKAVGTDIKKLKMLITVVDRSKTLFYMDLLEQFEVNMQTVIYGKGTAGTEMLSLLGLRESDKAIIISFVREDMIQDIKETLSEKFEKIKNGKGIAFVIPMKSIIGVSVYQFLSNNKAFLKGDENNG
jgi:nitrogen regulatory protein PII